MKLSEQNVRLVQLVQEEWPNIQKSKFDIHSRETKAAWKRIEEKWRHCGWSWHGRQPIRMRWHNIYFAVKAKLDTETELNEMEQSVMEMVREDLSLYKKKDKDMLEFARALEKHWSKLRAAKGTPTKANILQQIWDSLSPSNFIRLPRSKWTGVKPREQFITSIMRSVLDRYERKQGLELPELRQLSEADVILLRLQNVNPVANVSQTGHHSDGSVGGPSSSTKKEIHPPTPPMVANRSSGSENFDAHADGIAEGRTMAKTAASTRRMRDAKLQMETVANGSSGQLMMSKREVDGFEQGWKAKFMALQEKYDRLRDDHDEMCSKYDKLCDDHDTLRDKHTEVLSENNDLRGQVELLEDRVEWSETEVGRIGEYVQDLKAENNRLLDKITEVTQMAAEKESMLKRHIVQLQAIIDESEKTRKRVHGIGNREGETVAKRAQMVVNLDEADAESSSNSTESELTCLDDTKPYMFHYDFSEAPGKQPATTKNEEAKKELTPFEVYAKGKTSRLPSLKDEEKKIVLLKSFGRLRASEMEMFVNLARAF